MFFHILVWGVQLTLFAVSGIYFWLDQEMTSFVSLMTVTFLFFAGWKKVDNSPLQMALISWFGKRTLWTLEDGWKFVPIWLGFSFEPVEVKNQTVKIPVKVISAEEYEVKGLVSATVRPVPKFGRIFVDNDGFQEIVPILTNIFQTAIKAQGNGWTLDQLTQHNGTLAIYVVCHVESDDVDRNDWIGNAGVMIVALQVDFEQPEDIRRSRLEIGVNANRVTAFNQQQAAVTIEAVRRYNLLVEAGENPSFSAILEDTDRDMRLVQGQSQEVLGSSRNLVMTGDNQQPT